MTICKYLFIEKIHGFYILNSLQNIVDKLEKEILEMQTKQKKYLEDITTISILEREEDNIITMKLKFIIHSDELLNRKERELLIFKERLRDKIIEY